MAMTAAERRKKLLASKKSTSNLKAKTAYQKTRTENRRSKPAGKKSKLKASDMPAGWANPKKPKPKAKPKTDRQRRMEAARERVSSGAPNTSRASGAKAGLARINARRNRK